MNAMAPAPTKKELEAALALVLAHSANRTEAGGYLGRSYSTLARSKSLCPASLSAASAATGSPTWTTGPSSDHR